MLTRALALTLPLMMITGSTSALDTGPAATFPRVLQPPPTVASGTFLPYRPGSTAITYDQAVVPPGATAEFTATRTGYGTSVTLTTTGLVPDRGYGAHLHTEPCTANPDEAGPHYQNHKDPNAPSTNPVYANPGNEVWLDFTTSAAGGGTSATTHGWDFSGVAPPRSLVLHAEHTHTTPGEAGKAGARVACLTIPAF